MAVSTARSWALVVWGIFFLSTEDPRAHCAALMRETEEACTQASSAQVGSSMTTTARAYQELSLEQQIQRVRDAWYAKSAMPGTDPGWVSFVYTDRIILEHPDGLFSVPYTVNENGAISFGDPAKVVQEFVEAVAASAAPAGLPPAAGRRGLPAVAHDFIRTTGRLLGLSDEAEATAPEAAVRASSGDGLLLEAPFRICRDEERYVGGLVLTPGDDNDFGDIWEADDIRLMAYRFMEQSRHIDLMHTTKVVAQPVESYYFPTAEEGGQDEYTVYEETIPGGSWWLGSRVVDDDTWELVKEGKLKGYSMFAVKMSKREARASRSYESRQGQAPDGQHMTADDWEITMVSLVDKPAVRKATYVKMRRAPDGQAMITRPENRGVETEMNNVRRIAAYHDDHPEASEPGAESTAEEPPDGNAEVPETGEQQAAESEAAAVLPSEVTEGLQQMFQSFLEEQVRPMVESALAPLRDSVLTLETRQARITGSGALPGGRLANAQDESDEPRAAPSWANSGSRPRRVGQS